jgi:hypothetical protein
MGSRLPQLRSMLGFRQEHGRHKEEAIVVARRYFQRPLGIRAYLYNRASEVR